MWRLLLSLGFAWSGLAQTYQERIQASDQALIRGDYASAVKEFKDAYDLANTTVLDPPSAGNLIVVRYAELRAMLGDFTEAELSAKSVLELDASADLKARARMVITRADAFRGVFPAALAESP